MTVDVPAARLDATLDQLAALGSVVQRTTTSTDVTKTYVDTASRITTMKASVERVRALLGQATAIAQIVTIESELAKREAELESLQATLATLDKQTTMSTVSLSLSSPATATTPVDEGSGFLYGLRHGWSAFVGFLSGLATAVGALLPFLVTIAVLGSPVVLWWRRRLAKARQAPPAGPPAPQHPSYAAAPPVAVPGQHQPATASTDPAPASAPTEAPAGAPAEPSTPDGEDSSRS